MLETAYYAGIQANRDTITKAQDVCDKYLFYKQEDLTKFYQEIVKVLQNN